MCRSLCERERSGLSGTGIQSQGTAGARDSVSVQFNHMRSRDSKLVSAEVLIEFQIRIVGIKNSTIVRVGFGTPSEGHSSVRVN